MESDDFHTRPWRIESVSCRLSDDYSDILEAEYLHDDRISRRYHEDNGRDPNEIRHCYDESQAIEVLAVEPGWVHGERFYMVKSPGFDDEGCYVQDFGFGPYVKTALHVFWRSIKESHLIPSDPEGPLSFDSFLKQKLEKLIPDFQCWNSFAKPVEVP